MNKYRIIALLLLAFTLFIPVGSQAATYGTDLWTDLANYNFAVQATYDVAGRLKPIESFSDGESVFAHYLLGTACRESVIVTAPLNIAGCKTITIQEFTSTCGVASASPTITMTGASKYLVNVWGRLGKDDVYDGATYNIYKGTTSTLSAAGSVAMGQISPATGTTSVAGQPVMALVNAANTGTNGTYAWNISGYGGIILSASSTTAISSTTTHIIIRASK